MKLKSLLLGSVAAAGLSTGGAHAADLGVVLAALNVCDALGISGLTISSDSNCLAISGGVSYSASVDNSAFITTSTFPTLTLTTVTTSTTLVGSATSTTAVSSSLGTITVAVPGNALHWNSTVEAWLKFVGTADSSFGPAMAAIELTYTNSFNGYIDTTLSASSSASTPFNVSEAYVSVGDATILTAGMTGSIANMDDDEPLNYLGLFRSEIADTGVSTAAMPATGGHVIQLVSDLGNGVGVGVALENINSLNPTVVGVIDYAGDGITAHATGLFSTVTGVWAGHAGFTGEFDMFKVVGAGAFDSTGDWNVLGSASATFDMFTLAVSGEAAAGGEWGAGGSVSADIVDGVTINLGSRYFVGPVSAWEAAAGVSADVTETIAVAATVGAITSTNFATIVYFEGDLTWAPGGGFEAGVGFEANSTGAWVASFDASKDFE